MTHGWRRIGNMWVDPILDNEFTLEEAYSLHLRMVEEAISQEDNETSH